MGNDVTPMLYSPEQIARVCHEANRALQVANGESPVNAPWNVLETELRNSAIDGVLNILQNPETTPEDSHKNWLAFKANHGWVWGPEKDMEKKEHPCMVPYRELPEDQRVKDSIFHSIVHAMMVRVG